MANGIPGLLGIETEPSEDKNFSIKKAIDNHSTIEEYIRYQSLKKQYKKDKNTELHTHPKYGWYNRRTAENPTVMESAASYLDDLQFINSLFPEDLKGGVSVDASDPDKLAHAFYKLQQSGNNPYIMYNKEGMDIGSYRGSPESPYRAYFRDDKRRYYDKNTGEFFSYGEYDKLFRREDYTTEDYDYIVDNIISVDDLEGFEYVDTLFVTPPDLVRRKDRRDRGMDTYLAELAHAIQWYNKGKGDATWRDAMNQKTSKDYRKAVSLGNKERRYRIPGFMEHDAHSIIEPGLIKWVEHFFDWEQNPYDEEGNFKRRKSIEEFIPGMPRQLKITRGGYPVE